MNFNDFNQEQLQAAREYAAEINKRLAIECFDDNFGFASHVTQEDKEKYSKTNIEQVNAIIAGERDSNFTIAQRMYYFLTGDSVSFLGV